MKRTVIVTALLTMLISPVLIAAGPDQGGPTTLADRSDTAPGTVPSAGVGETEMPAGTISDSSPAGAISADSDELTHQGISIVPQKRGFLDFFSFLRSKPSPEKPAAASDQGPAPSNRPDAPSMPVLTGSGAAGSFVAQPGSDELAHQSLSSAPQDASMLGLTRAEDTAAMMSAVMSAGQHSAAGATAVTPMVGTAGAKGTPPDEISHQDLSSSLQDKGVFNLYTVSREVPAGSGTDGPRVLVAQTDPEELSHQALTAAIQKTDMFYSVKTGGVLPIMDSTFRDFLDYGGSVSFGAGKQIKDNLSVSVNMDMVMLTGDWSIQGDTQSIRVAAEEWYPGNYPGVDVIITPEDLPDSNLGTSYHGEAEAVIINAENLKKIDVHTDMYLFPVSVNALYRIKNTDRINAYVSGGLGYCVAIRDCNSNSIKGKYFQGPEYRATLNDSQTVTGLLLNLGAGVSIPVYDKLKFVAEASTTLYDLEAFDPVLEISFTKPNPSWYSGSDLSQWSYEDPLRVGVFGEVYVTNVSIGFVMPF